MLHIKAPKNKKGGFKKASFILELSSVQNIHVGLASNSRAIHSATTGSWAADEEGDGGTYSLRPEWTQRSLHNATIKIVLIHLRKVTISRIPV